MNWAYFHIVINHFPIVGVIIGALLLLAGLVFKNQGVSMSGLGTVVFAALTAIVAYQTGDPAEDAVKGLPGVAESLINRHEDIATIGMYLLIPAGLIAAMTLYSIWKKEKSVRFLLIIMLVLSLISSGMLVYVGYTGGQIRHSEFRGDAEKQNSIDYHKDKEKY
jgi:uncharacterized membrane protein